MKRNDMNINELIYNFFGLVPYALDELIYFYRPMVVKILAEKLGNSSRDPSNFSDYLNRADLLLIDCLYYFQGNKDTTFTAFYRKSMNNLSINILRMLNRERKRSYDMVYLDSKVKEDSNTYLAEVTGSKENVHDEVMARIRYEKIIRIAREKLDSFELRILELKLQEYTNLEIAEILGVSARSVSYRINKIKKYLLCMSSN